MVEASQVLLALQVAFFAASVALLLRRPPPPLQPLPPPLPVSEPSGGAERKKKGKAKRQVVQIRPQDRVAAPQPVLVALRPEVDGRLDASHLVRVSGPSETPDAAAVLILPGGTTTSAT
ncbi:unnamed protein product [Cladocopium goreaui]|uniref:Uncharacterized protein n=1 Tax=Cladocopium goreaui TaxID=2562237 RepID=A0A9P1G216_9DINO|nr:unnamed protein product [Cladocopium goreaui]